MLGSLSPCDHYRVKTMFRLGRKYQHLIHNAGCACHSPALQDVSRRLDGYSRRSFLSSLAASALAATVSSRARAQSAPSKILFRQIRLFDGRSDTLKSGVQILVEGNRITSVDTGNAEPPSDATVIDCNDRILMPGLIDAHWHTLYAAVPLNVLMTGDLGFVFTSSTAEAERTLMRGFTTVRDMGGPVFSFKQAVDTGIIPGPRIFPSGAMITTSGGHGDLRAPLRNPA